MVDQVSTLELRIRSQDAERRLDKMERELGQTQRASDRTGGAFNRLSRRTRALGRASSAATGAVSRLAGVFGVGAISAGGLAILVRSTLNYADAIGKTADVVGISTDALQEYRLAADLTGVSQNSLDAALQRFARRTGEAAAGTGTLKASLEANNIALRDGQGRLRGNEDLLDDFADAVQNASSEQERLTLVFNAFGREGASLVNTLRNGAQGLEELREIARSSGAVIEESLIRTAEDVNDRWTVLATRFQATIGRGILIGIEEAFNAAPVIWELAASEIEIRLAELKRVFDIDTAGIVGFFRERFATLFEPSQFFFNQLADGLRLIRESGGIEFGGLSIGAEQAERAAAGLDKVVGAIGRLQSAFAGDANNNRDAELEAETAAIRARTQAAVLDILTQQDEQRAFREKARELRRLAQALGQVSDATAEANGTTTNPLQDRVDAIIVANRTSLEEYNAELAELQVLLQAQSENAVEGFSLEVFGRASRAAQANLLLRDEVLQGLASEAEAIRRNNQTVQEAYGEEIALIQRISDLANSAQGRAAGIVFTDEDRLRAIADAQDTLVANMERYDDATRRARQASDEFGRSIAKSLEDAILSGQSLGEVLKSLADDLLRIALRRAVIDVFAQGISNAVAGFFTPAPATPPPRVDPGNVGPITPLPQTNAQGANLTRIALPLRDSSASSISGVSQPVRVEVTNNGTPQAVESAQSRVSGNDLVVSVITDDLSRRGPIATSLETAYGVRRG